jgi:uncharacterized protein (TIGR03382 family)
MATPARGPSYTLALLLGGLCLAPVGASAATYSVAPFTITIPDGIPASAKIRGAIAVQHWSPMMNTGAGKPMLDAFVVDQRLATITAGFQDRDMTLADIQSEYRALITAFESLATIAGRPELRYVGFIFQGCSVHGARSLSEGLGDPDRTIAAVSFCGRDYALFNLVPSFSAGMQALSFPHLQVSNGNDLDRVPWNDATTRQVRSEARGLWTSSLHPRLGHCEAAADGVAFELLWLREAIVARVPAEIPDGPYALTELSDASGWLGDYTMARSADASSIWGTGYRFESPSVFSAASVPATEIGSHFWFPTEVAAKEWKHYAETGTCCLGLSPTPSSDGPQPPTSTGPTPSNADEPPPGPPATVAPGAGGCAAAGSVSLATLAVLGAVIGRRRRRD